MADDGQVEALVQRWLQLRRQGLSVSAAELCRDRPDLQPAVARRLDALRADPAPTQEFGGHGGLPPPPPLFPDFALLRPDAEPVPGYRLIHPLGRGGFGVVWKAWGPGGFHVAIKFLPVGETSTRIEELFLLALKDIHHPHVLPIYGAWQREGFLIVAMELADRTLLDRQREAAAQGDGPGIPVLELLAYLRDAAAGIDFLNEPRHEVGGKGRVAIQHRDIKPQNLFLVGGSVKVADFGLAKALEHSVASHTGGMTPGFAAPEFFRGQTYPQSDQYSLAITYCQLRGGRLPFEGSAAEIMAGHLTLAPDLRMLPEAEWPAVARALAKNPWDRWPTCRAFVEGLAEALAVPAAAPLANPALSGVVEWPLAREAQAPRPSVQPAQLLRERLGLTVAAFRRFCLVVGLASTVLALVTLGVLIALRPALAPDETGARLLFAGAAGGALLALNGALALLWVVLTRDPPAGPRTGPAEPA
jgi:hypothetical protein